MLTFVEAISLAGDRAKQNDDAFGFAEDRAWVLDGATDLSETPLTNAASDASWIAHEANARLHCAGAVELREQIRAVSEGIAQSFSTLTNGAASERWRLPIASLLMIRESDAGLEGVDLGDCRAFALDARVRVAVAGGDPHAADDESALAARQADAEKPLLQRDAISTLRARRAAINHMGAHWTFCVDPACADHVRGWSMHLTRPAHVLLLSDGFSALVDRYNAYDAAGLVRAAIEKGLHELARELRAIESADSGGAKHPRFKKSDDATALLMRLT